MVNSKLKNLVQHIQKKAQEIPSFEGNLFGGMPIQHSTRSTEIVDMQVAMQNLAKTISSTIDYNSLMQSMQHTENVDKKSFNSSLGKDAFSNFIVNRYLRSSNIKGVEYDSNPNKTQMTQKNPSDLKNMFIILDSIMRIGQAKSELQTDGVWGPRTNNALKNIAAVADAIVRLGKDLGIESKSFDSEKVQVLPSLIPEKDTDITGKEKIQRASQITVVLKGIQSLFLDFKQQVLMNPTFRNFIDGEPLFKLGPAQKKSLSVSQEEGQILSDLQTNSTNSGYVQNDASKFNVILPKEYLGQQNVKPFQISGADLVTPESFELWVNRNSILMNLKRQNPQSWNIVAKNILNQIKTQVQQKLQGIPNSPLQEIR